MLDDVAHTVDEEWAAIPPCLDIARCTDVVVGAGNMRTPWSPAFGDVGWHFVTTAFQQREESLKFARIGRMHSDVEAIGCLHRHQHPVAIGIDGAVRFSL